MGFLVWLFGFALPGLAFPLQLRDINCLQRKAFFDLINLEP
jgi:hypothetical protein